MRGIVGANPGVRPDISMVFRFIAWADTGLPYRAFPADWGERATGFLHCTAATGACPLQCRNCPFPVYVHCRGEPLCSPGVSTVFRFIAWADTGACPYRMQGKPRPFSLRGIVGADPCVRPMLPRYSDSLHGQTRGSAPTGCRENRGRFPCVAL
ncbi:hypothetical protein GKODMF_06915 [Candidatus Electrothrix gigas]